MAEDREAKRCVVFGVEIKGYYGPKAVSFYGVDSLFSPVEVEAADGQPNKDYHIRKLDDKTVIPKPLTTLDSYYLYPTYASWENLIYRVGGGYEPYEWSRQVMNPRDYRKTCKKRGPFRYSNRVQCWNSLRPEKGWRRHSLMHQSRREPHVLFLGSKMFVAGGCDIGDEDGKNKFVFMEVMESRRVGWVALDNPPDHVSLDQNTSVSAAWQEEGKLIFGSAACDYFYAYTPASSSWERCDHLPFHPSLVSYSLGQIRTGVVVGGRCLWLDFRLQTRLIGLNLSNGKYFLLDLAMEGVLPSSNCWHYTPVLVPLGEEDNNKVALLWRDKVTYRVRGERGASEEETSSEEGKEYQEDQVSSESSEEGSSESSSESSEGEEEGSIEEEKGGGSNTEIPVGCHIDEYGNIHEDEETKEERVANEYGGYHLVEFIIDFARAHKKGSFKKIRKRASRCSGRGVRATGCLTVTSRRKLIAPSHDHRLRTAFAMDVTLLKYTCNTPGPKHGGAVLRECDEKKRLGGTVLQECKNKTVVCSAESNSTCKKRRK